MKSLTNKDLAYLEFLRFCLDEQATMPKSVKDIDWEDFYLFAKKHTIVATTFWGVDRIDKELRPNEELLFRWYSLTEKIRKRNVIANQEAAKITKKFDAEGFYTCVLKGQGNALLYPLPASRASGDIDLWVYPKHLQPIDLDAAKVHTMVALRKMDPKATVQYHHSECELGFKTIVEIHFTPSFLNSFYHNRRLQSYFQEVALCQFNNTVSLPDDFGTINVPTCAFNRIYQISHIMRHFFHEGIGLRQLVDYYYLLKQGITDEEHEKELTLLKEMGMLKFTRGIMYIMHHVLGLPEQYLIDKPDPKLGIYILQEILTSGNMGRHDERYSFTEQNPLKLFFTLTTRVLKSTAVFPAESVSRPLFLIWHQWWKRRLEKKISTFYQ